MKTDWSFVGMGAAGAALAAHGSLRGVRCAAWYDVDPTIEETIKQQGGLRYSGIFGQGLLSAPAMAQSPQELANAAIIVVSVPADRCEAVADRLAGVLNRDHLVVLHCGYVGGARVFRRALEKAGQAECPIIVETINSLHLSGKPNAGSVVARSHKQWLELAGLAAGDAETALARLKAVWPELAIGSNPLQCGLNNPNSLGHIPVMLGHLGVLDSDHGDLTRGILQFSEAYTDRIVKLVRAFEGERAAVIRALGLKPLTVEEFDVLAYPPGTRLDEVQRFGPKFQTRYITEDLPCDLVPIEALAQLVACPTPLITAMIELANVAFSCDFRKTGRTVEKLGVDWIRQNAPALNAARNRQA